MIGSKINNVNVMKLLIEHGADINLQTADGRDALWIAAHAGNYEGFVTLIFHTFPQTSLTLYSE